LSFDLIGQVSTAYDFFSLNTSRLLESNESSLQLMVGKQFQTFS